MLCHYHSQFYFSLSRMNILLLFLVFSLVFLYDYSLYPNVTAVIDSTSPLLLAPSFVVSIHPKESTIGRQISMLMLPFMVLFRMMRLLSAMTFVVL